MVPSRPDWWTDFTVEIVRELRADPSSNMYVDLLIDEMRRPGCPEPQLIELLAPDCRCEANVCRVTALLLGDEYADAVRWLDWFADALLLNSFKELMVYADQYQERGYGPTESVGLGQLETSEAYHEEFWRCWELVTGRTSIYGPGALFRCSC